MLALSHVSLARLNYISQNALSYGMRQQRDSWVIWMEIERKQQPFVTYLLAHHTGLRQRPRLQLLHLQLNPSSGSLTLGPSVYA